MSMLIKTKIEHLKKLIERKVELEEHLTRSREHFGESEGKLKVIEATDYIAKEGSFAKEEKERDLYEVRNSKSMSEARISAYTLEIIRIRDNIIELEAEIRQLESESSSREIEIIRLQIELAKINGRR